MYTAREASQLRQEFWTTFGKYMSPILSAEGQKINWINYKTGEQHIAFKMDADAKHATIAIEITHPDEGIRQLYFEQFLQLKNILHQHVGEAWAFEEKIKDEYGVELSKIFTNIGGVNIFNREDWPRLISFFKPRLVALDEFWSMTKYAFEVLR